MEVKGNQFGNIQNSDVIVNNGTMAATLTSANLQALHALRELQDRVAAASAQGALEPAAAEAAHGELAAATREVASGRGPAAVPALERTRHILGTAAGAAPLLDAIVNIVRLVQGSGGS